MKQLSNSQEKLIRALHSRQGRKKHRFLLVEGLRGVRTMIESGAKPEFIVISQSDLTTPGSRYQELLLGQNYDLIECDPKRFRQLSDAVESQGIMAIAAESELPDAAGRWKDARLVAYLDNISDPGNLGTILRTAAACRVDIVATSSSSADILNPKVIRASAGAIFKQPVARLAKLETFVGEIQSNNIVLMGSDAHASAPLDKVKVEGLKVCLAFGSEATGLSNEIREVCHSLFRIRSAPEIESFNVAAAAAIALHDVAHRMKLI